MAKRSGLRGCMKGSTLRCLLIVTGAAASLLVAATPAGAASQRPWSVYSVTVNGVKHTLGATPNTPSKLQARVHRNVASDAVARAILRNSSGTRGVGKTGRLVDYTCFGDCSYTVTAFDFFGGCGDVVLHIWSGFNGGTQKFHTWSHWCALGGFDIGGTPGLYTSQDSQSAWPAGTNNHINPYFYSWYSGHPRSGYHVRGEAYWVTCTPGCRIWMSRIDHYMHSDGTEYFHMWGAR
jgi:hypothetical protein